MSQIYPDLVNDTVVGAVRLALDTYAAEHPSHTVQEAVAAASGSAPMPAAQEKVVRRAIVTGLRNLRLVQLTVAALNLPQDGEDTREEEKEAGSCLGAAPEHGEENDVSVATPSTTDTARMQQAKQLSDAMERLLANRTALREVVQQTFTTLRTHIHRRPAASMPAGRERYDVVSDEIYAATPAVTGLLERALQEQQAAAGVGTGSVNATVSVVSHLRDFSAVQWMWLSATLLLGYLVARFFFGRVLGLSNPLSGSGRRRTNTVLIGLPDSGKTALFAQLARHMQIRETRTSLRPNMASLLAATEKGMSVTAAGVKVVDCPGHPRLREHMLQAVGAAVNVVVVIDAVTVQDNQHEGVAALAELLLIVLQSPEFYGVRRLLFACTKRDEVTSYASKAVRKLLEAAMVASIESRQNAMGRVESVRDGNNAVIAPMRKKKDAGSGGRRYVLSVEGGEESGGGHVGVSGLNGGAHTRLHGGAEEKSFSFDQLGIPLAFVDVSSRPSPTEHKYSFTLVEDFLLGE